MRIALVGNPNSGKTTIFNALTGSRQHVGNWAGVTVEQKSGELELNGQLLEIVDLPGIYSLASKSEDERIATCFLRDAQVDLILNVLDASNLERNLYLTTQLMELERPLILALNMMDEAEQHGISIDFSLLASLLGCPVLPTVGRNGAGIEELKQLIGNWVDGKTQIHPRPVQYGEDLEREIQKIIQDLGRDEDLSEQVPTRWLAIQLLEQNLEVADFLEHSHARHAIQRQLEHSASFLQNHLGDDPATLIAEGRFGFSLGLMLESVKNLQESKSRTISQRLDRWLTHQIWALPIFLVILLTVYSLTFLLGKYPQDWISQGFAELRVFLQLKLPAGELTSLFLDGILPGVSAVVVFVPVIMLLMGCIAFLEDTGYLARAAFIMDRIMHLMGLHGKSFIPLAMGIGCNVPAILATRTIQSRGDRLITILIAPLVSCSARLQVFVLLAGLFFQPVMAALVLFGLHILGFLLAILMGRLLRSTFFRGKADPFVMELPPYRLPLFKSVLIHMWEKGSSFLTRVGSTILVGATLVWFLAHYPGIARRDWTSDHYQKTQAIQQSETNLEKQRHRLDELQIQHDYRIVSTSLAARAGRAMEPVLAPIFNPNGTRQEAWKDSIALISGVVAKEIVVSTLAVLYPPQPGSNADGKQLREALQKESGLTPLTSLAMMVFILIYIPCLGTLASIYRETRSFLWTTFSLAYPLGLAWLLAWLVVILGQSLGMA